MRSTNASCQGTDTLLSSICKMLHYGCHWLIPAQRDVILTHQLHQLGIIYEFRKSKHRKPPDKLKTLGVQPNCEPSDKIISICVRYPEPHTISTSTANLVSQGLASTSNREGESTTSSSTQPLFPSLVSMFNLKTSHKLLDATKNEFSNTFVSILNPNTMQHLNLAQQIVHTMANAKTRAANNTAAAYSS